jgi:tetratricopeptide (TPR) repeat protein
MTVAAPGGWLRRFVLFAFCTLATRVLAAPNIDALWEHGDPAGSEARFRAALPGTNVDERLELLTQIARTYCLRRQFDEAHRMLDTVVAELKGAGPRPRVRYLLERGRTINSRPLFVDGFELARSSGIDGLAVDAAHMVAITYGGTDAAIDWNRRGLALARASKDAKAQALIPAMLNNSAWDLHDLGRYAEALPRFEQALVEWSARSKPAQIQFARWSVAHCLRSLGRFPEALSMQLSLEKETTTQNDVDGYVLEEIAELYDARGRPAEARLYFARAATALADDADLAKNHPDRLARVRAKAQ